MIKYIILDILKKPMLNIFCLLLLFSIGILRIFTFEIELLNRVSNSGTLIIIPFILVLNTFLCNEKWQKVVSGLVFVPFFLFCCFSLYLSFAFPSIFICRYTESEGYLVAVYASPTIGFRNSGHCIIKQRQIRIIPGILLNQGLLYNSVCPDFRRTLEPRVNCPG